MTVSSRAARSGVGLQPEPHRTWTGAPSARCRAVRAPHPIHRTAARSVPVAGCASTIVYPAANRQKSVFPSKINTLDRVGSASSVARSSDGRSGLASSMRRFCGPIAFDALPELTQEQSKRGRLAIGISPPATAPATDTDGFDGPFRFAWHPAHRRPPHPRIAATCRQRKTPRPVSAGPHAGSCRTTWRT